MLKAFAQSAEAVVAHFHAEAVIEFPYAHALGSSLDSAMLPEYENMFGHFLKDFLSPKVMNSLSTPEQIAEVIYESATDNKDQLRYIAGNDAKAIYEQRQNLGVEGFRKMIEGKYLRG